jgi:hypothetical protein
MSARSPSRNRAEDEQRDAGAERHLRETEGELTPLAAVHGESHGSAGDLRGQQVTGDAKNSLRTSRSPSATSCACFRN